MGETKKEMKKAKKYFTTICAFGHWHNFNISNLKKFKMALKNSYWTSSNTNELRSNYGTD